MDKREQKILLEELREEVNYLHKDIQQKSKRASRIIRFNFLAITVVTGFLRFGNEGKFELKLDFVLGGIILIGSMLSALYCLLVASQRSRSARSILRLSRTIGSELERKQLIEDRVAGLSERVRDYELRNRFLNDTVTVAILSGPLGAVILFTATLESAEEIKRGILEPTPTLVTSLLVIFILIAFSIGTVRWTRKGTLSGNRYSLKSED